MRNTRLIWQKSSRSDYDFSDVTNLVSLLKVAPTLQPRIAHEVNFLRSSGWHVVNFSGKMNYLRIFLKDERGRFAAVTFDNTQLAAMSVEVNGKIKKIDYL